MTIVAFDVDTPDTISLVAINPSALSAALAYNGAAVSDGQSLPSTSNSGLWYLLFLFLLVDD